MGFIPISLDNFLKSKLRIILPRININYMEKIFYNPELTQILNKLIPYIPVNGSFNLYEISKTIEVSFDDFIIDGLAKVEENYIQIANELIANDLALLRKGNELELKEKGKELIKLKTWENYIDYIKLEEKAKKNEMWTKAYWGRYELIRTAIIVLVTLGLTLLIQRLIGNKY
jgi:hypothetical protein